MRLRRIEIRSFRKLVGPVVLDGLGDGLTVIAGDNEEGKSTVLAALQAALFEHHAVGGAVREAMAPLGRPATPEIALDFELAGERYALRKVFRKGGGTRLVTPDGELRDDAAEQRLQQLLRFERRQGRAEPRPEHSGLQALFWVEQGTTFQGFASLAGGRERLTQAIAAEVGGVASGPRGQEVLRLVENELAQLVTPRTGKETGALAEASRRVDELAAELGRLEEPQRRYQAAVDELARLRDERRRLVEADELGSARTALERVRRELEVIATLEARRDQARAALAERSAAAQRLADQASQRAQQIEALEACARQLVAAHAETEQAQAECDAAEQALAAADRAERAAVELQARVEQRRLEVERRLRLIELEVELGRLLRARDEAGAADHAVRELRARLVANPASAERLAAARKDERAQAEAQAGLRAVATRVELRPGPGGEARRDGRPLDPGQALHITERTELELLPFGRVVLSPGAGELEMRRAALVRAQEALSSELAALGVTSLAAAEALLRERTDLERQLAAATARLSSALASHDAQDVAMLDDHLAALQEQRDRLRAHGAGEDGDDPGVLRAALAELERERGRLRDGREAARAETERCARRASEQRAVLARKESVVEQLRRQQQAVAEQLAAARERVADAMLAEQAAAAQAALAEAQAVLAAVEREIVAANPDIARERVALAERRMRQLEQELHRLDGAIQEREIELRTLGADAVGERLEECRQRLALAEDDVARLRRRARAWRLLRDELQAAASAASEALLAPVRDRLTPYLRRLFPTGEPVVDAQTLAVTHLRRGGATESFEQLSLGTREQIAVLVRLALARLLHETEGEAPCLVLDDALVYADAPRFEIMKAILAQAARELQIVILTCRPRDYLGLEARQIRLAEQARPAGA